MGGKINQIGNRYGKLIVIEQAKERYHGHVSWVCKCDCGKEIIAPGTFLRNGKIKSCGCYHLKNEIGNKYGRLLVIAKTQKKGKDGSYYWKCKCDCGKEIVVNGVSLRQGTTLSCGCLNKEIHQNIGKKYIIDETGKKYGKLTVIKYIGHINSGTGWLCRCDCGNEKIISGHSLRSGTSKSCGCVKSKGEEDIIQILQKNNISFETEKIINIDNKNLRFDFYINNYFIEFDGKQHFQYSNKGWNTKEKFELTRKYDLIKNKYCFNNNIPLIRIPYDVDYTIDDLKLETTRFLLTPENEKEYYESRIV